MKADQRVNNFVFLPVFFLLAIILTWPLAANLNSHLPAGSDSIVHYWNSWWVGQALVSGQSPYHTDLLFAPNGLSLVYHNFAWVHILGSLLLSPLAGALAAYNLTLLINLALCGFFAATLVHYLTKQKTTAFLAGLIYIAWPYRLTQPDHPNLHSSWPIPLFMLALIRLLDRRRWQDGLWCGLAFALIGYMRWQMLIPTVFIGGTYFLIWLVLNYRSSKANLSNGQRTTDNGQLSTEQSSDMPNGRYRSAIFSLGFAATIALVTLSPPIYLLAQESQQNPAQLVLDSEVQSMQTDLLAYVTPAPWNSIIGRLTTQLYDNYYPNRGSRAIYSPFIGYTTLMLCAIALWRLPKRETIPWLAIGLILILLALGPTLLINGRQINNVPMFYRLFDRLFIVRLLREPDRFNMFLALPTAVLAGYGMLHLSQSQKISENKNAEAHRGLREKSSRILSILSDSVVRQRQHYRNRWLIGGLSLLILAEYLVIPLPIQLATTSAFYEFILKDSGAVLDIPLDPFKSKPYMLAQITHGRPIAQGHASRYPAGAFAYLESNSWLNETLLFDGQPPLHQDVSRQLNILAADGFEYLILHKNQIRSNYIEKWRSTIPFTPDFEDNEIIVFKIDSLQPKEFNLMSEPLPGFGPISMIQSASCQNPNGVLGLDVVWGLLEDSADFDSISTQLRLRNENSQWLSDIEPLTRSNLTDMADPTFFAADYEWDLPADITLGRYTFELILLEDGSEAMEGTLAALQPVIIQNEPCRYPVPDDFNLANAQFSDTARLLGYQLNQEADQLNLTLLWRPEQRTGVEYTVFVHLFDLESGEILSQHDGMPRNWSYPISRWGLGETIDEQITLNLTHVPLGNYGLGVGLYNGSTGERLPIMSVGDSWEVEGLDGRLELQTVIID